MMTDMMMKAVEAIKVAPPASVVFVWIDLSSGLAGFVTKKKHHHSQRFKPYIDDHLVLYIGDHLVAP